jgi:hypothetical protein
MKGSKMTTDNGLEYRRAAAIARETDGWSDDVSTTIRIRKYIRELWDSGLPFGEAINRGAMMLSKWREGENVLHRN